MATVTVKNIPADTYERLKEVAAPIAAASISEIIVCLERALGGRKIDPETVLARARRVAQNDGPAAGHGCPVHEGQNCRSCMIVVDTNIIGYLYLNSERSGLAEQSLQKDAEWAAPLLWRSELRNVLALYVRKRHLPLHVAQEIMDQALGLMSGHEYEVASAQVLALAAGSACSAYDCEFVALARDLDVTLVTVDKQVLAQFPDVAIGLDSYIR